MLSWILLGIAIVTEVLGTTCLKMSDGLTRPGLVLGVVVFYGASIVGLALALRTIDMSVAYAIWAGMGVTLVTLVGVAAFGEPFSFWRAVFIVFILTGVVGLRLVHS